MVSVTNYNFNETNSKKHHIGFIWPSSDCVLTCEISFQCKQGKSSCNTLFSDHFCATSISRNKPDRNQISAILCSFCCTDAFLGHSVLLYACAFSLLWCLPANSKGGKLLVVPHYGVQALLPLLQLTLQIQAPSLNPIHSWASSFHCYPCPDCRLGIFCTEHCAPTVL